MAYSSLRLPRLSAAVVAGSANNQLATAEDGERLFRAGILYAPDYVINTRGLIHVALNDSAATRARIGGIGERLSTIFATSAQRAKHRKKLRIPWRGLSSK